MFGVLEKRAIAHNESPRTPYVQIVVQVSSRLKGDPPRGRGAPFSEES